MTTTIDHRTHDQHQHAKSAEHDDRDSPLAFTPDETPDATRAWLVKQRYQRELEASLAVPSKLHGKR